MLQWIGGNADMSGSCEEAVKNQPYEADVHYNCGYAYEANGNLFDAYEQYMIASEIISAGNTGNVLLSQVLEMSQRVLERILDIAERDYLRMRNWHAIIWIIS